MGWLKGRAKIGFERIELWFDKAFGPAWNPFYYLGALGYFFYWIVAVTGIYLYIFMDTDVGGAYQSIERITHAQWYAGGVMRSLHRYASDALVVVMMVHLLREFALDRYRGARWFSWFTGVPILWLVFASGISGYWLVWDRLAQYIALATTEWFDTLAIFGTPIARNFLNEAALSGRFFTLMVFVHIFVPLFLLLVMWIHLQRMSRSKVNPPRGLALGSFGSLLALSFAWPALSQGPADLDTVPGVINLDWFYLAGYPLADMVPGLTLWAGFALITAILIWMPWLPPKRPEPVAVVDLDNCNGCGRLRYLRRRLPTLDPVPPDARIGDRHRPARAGAQGAARSNPGGGAKPVRRGPCHRLWLPQRPRPGVPGRPRRRGREPAVHGHAGAIVHRFRHQPRSRRRRPAHGLPRGRLPPAPGHRLDRAAHRRHPRPAPAPAGAARAHRPVLVRPGAGGQAAGRPRGVPGAARGARSLQAERPLERACRDAPGSGGEP
jgi:hypothetical protein